MAVMTAAALTTGGAVARGEARPAAAAAVQEPAPVTTTALTTTAPTATPAAVAEPACMRVKGAEVCVGPDGSDRPGIWVEDTRNDKLHAAVEYHLNEYLGTKYVIHNLGGKGEIRGTREIGRTVTFRAAVYEGNHRVRVGRWKTVRNLTKYPVKRDTGVTPAAARGRSELCSYTKGGASVCFHERDTYVFACDTRADEYQARAEYFVAGDPTARYEIHQLAGLNTCGKAEHGDQSISMYRASVYNGSHRVATRQYKYN
ncbi:hypothetical protein ABT158_35205 [Nonomuraea sp. NPDC001636]|uniref:hypothetical protein n=1 Tax=Nonomuraea sp. NPDC001636 TaxID=3154391 RepID=UPI00331E6148